MDTIFNAINLLSGQVSTSALKLHGISSEMKSSGYKEGARYRTPRSRTIAENVKVKGRIFPESRAFSKAQIEIPVSGVRDHHRWK